MWNDTTKTGFMYTMQAPEAVTPAATEAAANVTPQANEPSADNKGQSFLAEINKFKNACKPGNIDASMFDVPQDVKFQDMDALINQMKKIPSAGANPADYQQYVQQMMQKAGQ